MKSNDNLVPALDGRLREESETMKLAQEVGDDAIEVLLDGILKDEEARLHQIEQMGWEDYLTEQVKGEG